MKAVVFFLLAAATIHFDIVDIRGKRPSGVAVEASEAGPHGWRRLRFVKTKPGLEILWPYDLLVKEADGPGATPVVVGEPLSSSPYIAAGQLLRGESCDPPPAWKDASSFAKGVALFCSGKAADAVDPLALALKERERQLTRVPSEIFAAAMLSGKALLAAGKYDDAAVAFLKALRQRPGHPMAMLLRSEALTKAGKPEAASSQ